MSAILPIPTGRTSDYLARSRLVQQIQSDQVDLLRLQTQLSTGRRIFAPSDDPGASVRAITLQRTLERKDQLQINVASSTSKLAAAESALTQVSDILNDVRAKTLGVIDTVATDEERQAVLLNIDEAITSLTRFANTQYQDSFLFGGTRALQSPFVKNGNYIEYRGNEANLQAHVEIGQLFDTNISGDDVFGGFSEPVRGSVDLDLQVSESTYLSQLNAGSGISPNGAIELSVGLNSYVVDLSSAYTLGDVARLIEQGAPAGSGISVDVTGDGLTVHPGSAGLAIRDVSGGQTAQELGIRQETQLFPPDTFGGDLNPVLRKTSQLSDLAGTKSTGRLSLGALNAAIKLRSEENGDAYDDLTVNVLDTAALGAESLSYSSGPPPELTINVNEGTTTAEDVVDLINADGSVPFEASVDFSGADPANLAGQGLVAAQAIANATSGGSGAALDLSSGLRITNGDGEVIIDTSSAETVEDLLDIFNRPEYGLTASINEAGDGLDVRSRRAGANFTIGENGGTLAADLGLRTFVDSVRVEDFNRGAGVITEDSYFLSLDHDDGAGNVTTYQVNLSDDALGDFSTLVDEPGGSLDLRGSFRGASGNSLEIVFAENAAVDTHSASLADNTLTVTVGTNGLANGATIDIDAIFSSLTDADFTDNVLYTAGDIVGNYTVSAGLPGGDDGASVTFSGGGEPLTVASVNSRIFAATSETVTAGIVGVGNGFNLSINNSSGQTLRAHGLVAERLGFFDGDAGETEAYDTGGALASADRNTQEVDSVFNTLLRLRTALDNNDPIAISDAFDMLGDDLNRATFARSELGSRVQNLEVLQIRLEDEEVQLKTTLSEAIDADYAEVISDFTARQFALQASLQTSASLLQMSVLNFI